MDKILLNGFCFNGEIKLYMRELEFEQARAIFMMRFRMLPTVPNLNFLVAELVPGAMCATLRIQMLIYLGVLGTKTSSQMRYGMICSGMTTSWVTQAN